MIHVQLDCAFRQTPSVTASHPVVTECAARIENMGHKLYVDIIISSSALFDDLHTKTVHCCGTVRPNRKLMRKNFGQKMKLKWGDIKTGVRGIYDSPSVARQMKCTHNDRHALFHQQGKFLW